MTCQTTFEPLLDLVAEGGDDFSITFADASESRSERGDKDRAEEKSVLGGQSFLVAIVLIVGPGGVREFKHLAGLDTELLEVSVSCEGDEKISFPPRVAADDYSLAFFGRDYTLSNHFRENGICLVEDMFKAASGSIISKGRKHRDEPASGAQFSRSQGKERFPVFCSLTFEFSTH